MSKLPAAWLEAGQTKTPVTAKGKQVTARIDMSDEVAGAGLCPDCRKPMEKVFASGIGALVCMHDRITLPMPDSGEVEQLNKLDLSLFQ